MGRLAARLIAVLLLLLPVPLTAETLSELFQKAKAQVKSQSWRDALTTLDRLDAESATPGNEAMRRQLIAPIAFYRGVCEANLDEPEKAQADFAAFRRANPDAALDGVAYSKKVIAAFDAAGRTAAPTLLQTYERFQAPSNATASAKADERWADGAVKWIMTADEARAWPALKSNAERADFVERFWAARDARRAELDRRIAFADAYLQVDEKLRGSLTDPGMVFVLLGPPTRTGRKPIMANEERSIASGNTTEQVWWLQGQNSVHMYGANLTDASAGFRDVWHYGHESLPKGVSIYELDVTFVTKPGYGRAVLQRDAAVLSTLEAAKRGQS